MLQPRNECPKEELARPILQQRCGSRDRALAHARLLSLDNPADDPRLPETDSCQCGRPRAELLVRHLSQWPVGGVAELVQIG